MGSRDSIAKGNAARTDGLSWFHGDGLTQQPRGKIFRKVLSEELASINGGYQQ
jgi:hypothetical protein